MWLTTVTLDLVGIRALAPEISYSIIQSIVAKRQELRDIDGKGGYLPGSPELDPIDSIDPTQTTLVVKRVWNTELAAQELVDFLNAASEHVTATVEEQV